MINKPFVEIPLRTPEGNQIGRKKTTGRETKNYIRGWGRKSAVLYFEWYFKIVSIKGLTLNFYRFYRFYFSIRSP